MDYLYSDSDYSDGATDLDEYVYTAGKVIPEYLWDKFDKSAVGRAIKGNDLDGLKKLTTKKGKITRSFDRTTLILIALDYDLPLIFDYLMSLDNMELDLDCCCSGGTPLPLIRAIQTQNAKHYIEKLLEEGADVNAMSHNGHPPLHQALRCGRADLCELLIENGADVNLGGSSFHHAFHGGSSECVNLLIYHNTLVDWDKWNKLYMEALDYCERKNDYSVMDYFSRFSFDNSINCGL